MNMIEDEKRKWIWRPKRWWIFLIVFWLFSTAGGKHLFGIEPKTNDQVLFIMAMTFMVVIVAAITDRQHTLIPKRIFWVIIAGVLYSIVSFCLFLLVGSEAAAAVFTSLIVVVIAMRRSKLFVEPGIDIKLVEQQKKEMEISTPAG